MLRNVKLFCFNVCASRNVVFTCLQYQVQPLEGDRRQLSVATHTCGEREKDNLNSGYKKVNIFMQTAFINGYIFVFP